MQKLFSKTELNDIIAKVKLLIVQAGEIALKNWNNIEIANYKDNRDIATKTDYEIEFFLQNKIGQYFPSHGFYGEETERINKESEYQWLIDPIDGTKYYAKKAPFFYIHIALLYNNEPILGLIYNPVSKQLFSASIGNGAYCNDELLKLDSQVSFNDAIIDFDFGGLSNKSDYEKKWMEKKLFEITNKCYRIRIASGALSIYLVTGAIDAYIDFSGTSKPQDLAARFIIMKESGCRLEWVTNSLNKRILLSARENVFTELKEILSLP